METGDVWFIGWDTPARVFWSIQNLIPSLSNHPSIWFPYKKSTHSTLVVIITTLVTVSHQPCKPGKPGKPAHQSSG